MRIAIVLLFGLLAANSYAGDGTSSTNATAPKPLTNREGLRQELKNLSPAERQARLKDLREQLGKTNPQRELWEKRREELKTLPLGQRESKVREWRQQAGTNAVRSMTPEEREARIKGIRARLEEQLKTLRERKAEGKLTEEESKRLERMESIATRFAKETRPTAGAAN